MHSHRLLGRIVAAAQRALEQNGRDVIGRDGVPFRLAKVSGLRITSGLVPKHRLPHALEIRDHAAIRLRVHWGDGELQASVFAIGDWVNVILCWEASK